uniref:Uncharacterized LOC110949059 n=1 Tax=Acanthochromis polyacanthus TaxID=80966 RepID=A0A3Q1GNV9_9TELE
MKAGKQLLLLLAVFTVVARCQQKPNVSMSPYLKQIFTGDLFYLTCNASGNTVKWYKDGVEQQMWADGTVRIAVTSPKDSGIYQCQINGPKSDPVHIKVQDYVPTASLSINTGQPVMKTGDSVVLKIENEDGLQGWNCWVNRGEKTNKVKLKLKNDTVSLNFQTTNLTVPETIYWCTDNTGCRTNQITLRTSDKQVSLEMYPQSAVVGQSLTLRCLAWGTDQISHTVFYKGDSVVKKGGSSTYEISPVSDDTEGTYKCHATFTHVARTSGPPYSVLSDHQDVLIQKRPVTAVLSEDMVCSCQSCPGNWSERYYKKHDQSWVRLSSKPSGAGTFSCRAVGARMRTSLSASIHVPHPNPSGILIIILIVGLVALIVAAVAYIWHKRRNATGPIYDDVALRLREEGDAKYETLQQASGREAEYDTLHPEAAATETKKSEYEQLRKDKMQEGVYHTLGMEGTAAGGAAGGEGGYEALNKEAMKEGAYHTLGMEGAAAAGGAAGGEGGYEALKKEEMKEGVYHTLGMEGAV